MILSCDWQSTESGHLKQFADQVRSNLKRFETPSECLELVKRGSAAYSSVIADKSMTICYI